MRNRDMPAGVEPMDEATGLTKREAAAIAIRAGVACVGSTNLPMGKMGRMTYAEYAVQEADALFDELEKGDG